MRLLASLVKDMSDNDTLYKIAREYSEKHNFKPVPDTIFEKRNVREVGLVVCQLPNGQIEYLTVVGTFGFVPTRDLVEDCVKKSGKVLLEAHTHPGGSAVPSAGDVVELLEELRQGLLSPGSYYCIGRIGRENGRRMLIVTCIVPKTVNVEEWEIPTIEEVMPYASVIDEVKVVLRKERLLTSIFDNDTAREIENLVHDLYSETIGEKYEIKTFKIELPN